jgi:tripartite-type tricarboxylate transporter receptor subunit TctC
VAFKGGAPLMTDLIGNHIAAGIDSLVDQIEHQRAGKIRILGIFAPNRYRLAPDIPTLAEQGVGGLPAIEGWFGAFVPAKTPKEVVARLDQSIGKILAMPQMEEKLNRMVIDVSYLPSSEFSKLQSQELRQWEPTVRESGFKPE